MAIAFRYHHYECFCSQIELTNLTIVKGGLGNSLNKKSVCFSEAAPLKMQYKCYIFSIKIHKNFIKCIFFCLKCAFFWFSLEAAFIFQISPCEPNQVETYSSEMNQFCFFSSILLRTKNGSSCYFGDCFHRRFSLILASRYHQHNYL